MDKKQSWRDVLKIHPAADLFPLMGSDELKALSEDIKANGLNVPIDLFSTGFGQGYLVLDGRNRLDAIELAGWRFKPDGPYIRAIDPTGAERSEIWGIPNLKSLEAEVYGGDPVHFDPYAYVVSVNIHRRHLTTAQKGELIKALLKATPERSDRSIAKDVKADHKTIAAKREKLEGTGEIPRLDKRVGDDGKARAQPAEKKPALVPTPTKPTPVPPTAPAPIRPDANLDLWRFVLARITDPSDVSELSRMAARTYSEATQKAFARALAERMPPEQIKRLSSNDQNYCWIFNGPTAVLH